MKVAMGRCWSLAVLCGAMWLARCQATEFPVLLFETLDGNKDGYITEEEATAAFETHEAELLPACPDPLNRTGCEDAWMQW